jgi:hypothetical protein
MSMINLIDLFGCYLGKAHLRPPNNSLVGQVGYAPALQDFQSCTSTKLVSVPNNLHKGWDSNPQGIQTNCPFPPFWRRFTSPMDADVCGTGSRIRTHVKSFGDSYTNHCTIPV